MQPAITSFFEFGLPLAGASTLTSGKKMKLLHALHVSLLLAISAVGAEPTWEALRDKMQKALGDEWTVASDFHNFTAIRRNVRVLNTINRIDPILSDRDPWGDALTI